MTFEMEENVEQPGSRQISYRIDGKDGDPHSIWTTEDETYADAIDKLRKKYPNLHLMMEYTDLAKPEVEEPRDTFFTRIGAIINLWRKKN